MIKNDSGDGLYAEIKEAFVDKTKLEQLHLQMQARLEDVSETLRCSILKCRPLSLLGFLWGLVAKDEFDQGHAKKGHSSELRCDVMVALEYLHAVLSSNASTEDQNDGNDALYQEVLALAAQVRKLSMPYCTVAAEQYSSNRFGKHTRTLIFHVMLSWVCIRGYRYQPIEAEFFKFILEPHNDALNQIYGADATEIARGLQAAIDAPLAVAQTPEDHRRARQMNAESRNLTKTSGLPPALLADLAYTRGSETDFFASGVLRGTPLRTMPGRIKPLIAINDGYYACDPNFIRDSTYRTIQRALLERLPDYQIKWKERQTELTENAFYRILHHQLQGAEVLNSVYYYDRSEKKWYENDVLILLGDVMLLIEVKAGVMALHSPELHFDQYANKIEALVLKAYLQCKRFLRYAASEKVVSLFSLSDGVYNEVRRLALADYRLILPIGLTVEAFTPISSYCKELDEIQPILGKHPFISMSIDDLFLLSHFLPTCGELFHYLDVRQSIAGIKNAFFYDEADQLGMYLNKNRFDIYAACFIDEGCDMLIFKKSEYAINRYFANPEWRSTLPPRQIYPDAVARLLSSIDKERGPRFLRADSMVRDMGPPRREKLAAAITELVPQITDRGPRHIRFLGSSPVLVCLQRPDYVDFIAANSVEGEAVALAAGAVQCDILVIYVRDDGEFEGAWAGSVAAPKVIDGQYAARMLQANKLLRVTNYRLK
ncbi:MAG TPA: hypothetical protein VF800_31870 [Telluria sp.]